MTRSPHAAPSVDEALGEALEYLTAGLTPLQILELFPQYEAELAPLLETAYRLRTTRWPTLSMAARMSGRERMHTALAQQRGRRRFILAPIWRQLGAGLALVLLAGTTYIASPVSPLRSLNRPRLTVTVPVVATVTWTTEPTATTKPTATATVLPTRAPATPFKIVEIFGPTETVDPEMGLKHTQPSATPTQRPSATPTRATRTRVPTSTWTPTPTQTSTAVATVATVAAVAPPSGAGAKAEPSPAASVAVPSPSPVPATATPLPTTPTKPTPTKWPTERPDPTESATERPPATSVPPSQTSEPTHGPTEAPVASVTVEAPPPAEQRQATHIPEPPEPPKTPGPAGIKPGAKPAKIVEPPRNNGVPPGQVIRAAVHESRRPGPPRPKRAKP